MNRYVSPKSRCSSLQQVEHLRLDRHVQRRHRLVEHHEPRVEGDGPGDPDALALAAGELVRVAVGVIAGEADGLQQVRDRRGGQRPAEQRVLLGEDLADGHPRVERGVRVLEDDLHVGPGLPQLRQRQRRDVAAGHLDGAAASAPAGAGSSGRPSTCRSPTRRPATASSPRAPSSVTPSTARTTPTVRRPANNPARIGKCVARSVTASIGRPRPGGLRGGRGQRRLARLRHRGHHLVGVHARVPMPGHAVDAAPGAAPPRHQGRHRRRALRRREPAPRVERAPSRHPREVRRLARDRFELRGPGLVHPGQPGEQAGRVGVVRCGEQRRRCRPPRRSARRT